MKKINKFLAVLLVPAMMFTSVAMPANTDAAAKKYVKSLKVSKGKVTISVGKTKTVKATVKVRGKASKNVSVKSNANTVAMVKVGKPNKSGVSKITIIGLNAGSAKVTVKTKAKGRKKKTMSKTIRVNVVGNSSNTTPGTVPGTVPGTNPTPEPGSQTTPPSSQPSPDATVTPVLNPAEQRMDPDYGATGFTADDYSVSLGTKDTYVEFKINKDVVSEEELKAQGYNVSGGVASATITCNTATYTFKKLPGSLNEIKMIKLDNMFAPMAATICAFHTVDVTPGRYYLTQYRYNPLCQMLNHIGNSEFCVMNNFDATHLYDQFSQHPELKTAYFAGAGPTNNYTPNEPYVISMVESPYIINEKTMVGGEKRPTTHMILISLLGDDAQRYIDVWQSSKGNWYALNEGSFDTYKQLTGSVKSVEKPR